MQITMMVPPTFNKELQYLNKEDQLLRWIVRKHRSNIVYGLDKIYNEEVSDKFRTSKLYSEDDNNDDEDDEQETQ